MSDKKPENETKKAISQVVRAYRNQLGWKGKPLSFVRFAIALSKSVQHRGIKVSYQAIKNWDDGIDRPDYSFMMQLANYAPPDSWQHNFAMDVLAVQWPELYQPGSEIGEKYCQHKQ
jgi:hypothetical protein